MKKLLLIILLFVFIPNLLSSQCHKALVTVSDLKINKLVVFIQDKVDELNDIKKERDELEDNDPYKGNLDAQIKHLEKELEKRLAYYRKYFKSYNEVRRLLLEKFNNNKDLVIQYMSTSSGLELQASRRGGQADYMMFCNYSMNLMAPDNNYWDKFSGSLYCNLTDVEKGYIIWTFPQNKAVLGRYDDPVENLFSNAWRDIANKIPRSSKLESVIRDKLDYKKAELEYTYDDEDKKEANGQETGNIKVSNISKEIQWGNPRPRNIAEFTLKVNQGTFVENDSSSVIFIPDEYEKNKSLKRKYKTYDCNKGDITEKLFETLTMTRTCFLGQGDETIIKEIKIPFECEDPFYTVIATEKITTKVKVIEKYRGISKDLKSHQVDKDVYYISIDAPNAKIIQYHVNKESTRKIHNEAYELNMETCKYELKSKDKLIKNMGGQNILKSEDEGWGFEDDTKIYVSLPSSEKELSFEWKKLRDDGSYYKKISYKKEIPQIAKSYMDKINDTATMFRKESKNSKGMEILKNLYNYPGTPKDVQCGGKVSMESLLIPPLDALQDPAIEFTIKIRPSTRNEITVMKKKMNLK